MTTNENPHAANVGVSNHLTGSSIVATDFTSQVYSVATPALLLPSAVVQAVQAILVRHRTASREVEPFPPAQPAQNLLTCGFVVNRLGGGL